MEVQRRSRHPECSAVTLGEGAVILSEAGVILSEGGVILSEAKDLVAASTRSFGPALQDDGPQDDGARADDARVRLS